MRSVDFDRLRVGDRVGIYEGPDLPLIPCEVMDKVSEHPGVHTVLVRIGKEIHQNLRYVAAVHLREVRR